MTKLLRRKHRLESTCNFLCSVTGQRTVTVSLLSKATDLSETHVLLGFSVLKNGNSVPTFRDKLSVQISRAKQSKNFLDSLL